MKLKSVIFVFIGLCLLAIGILPSQSAQAGANDNNVQWDELYHSATADNPRSEFVPSLTETFFSVDPSGLYYPSTQANVYVLVDNNDITGAQVIYWDGDSTEYAPMSYVADFIGTFKSQPSNQYSIWRATLPAPMSFAPAQGAGFNVCYRIQVWDSASNAWLRYTNGGYVNPLGQHVINADSSADNYCQTVQAFPTIGLVTGTDMQAENVVTRNIPLTISSAINAPITVNITYADGSAMVSDNDYTNTTTSFTIPANTSGSYGATLTGLITDDNKYELNDSFTVTLASVATGNASISLGSTISYILMNDDPVPTVSWATTTASQTEGNVGSAGYFFTANLSNPSYQTIIVDVNYADITATYPVDYGLSNTVTINAGSMTGLHTYLILGDTVDESNEDFTLMLGTVSGGTATVGAPNTATITILDDDMAGYTVNTSGVTAISEPNTTTSFTIQLNSMPTGTVDFVLFSTDITECTVSPTPFTLTDMTPQLITITAQDDGLADGTQPCGVSIVRTGGSATEYGVVPNPADVMTTVNDDDTAGYTLNTSGITAISEPNTTTSFTIQLNTMPSGTVDFALFSTDTTECTVSPTPFTLTDMTPQLITITAQDDGLADGTQPCGVSILRTGGTASEYIVVPNPADVMTTVNDNDTAGYTVNTSGITAISEPNTTTSFTIQLNTMPTGTVMIDFVSTDTTECLPSPTTFTFTDTTPQIITITAQDDVVLDGTQPCAISISRTGGTATEYGVVANPADVGTTVNDDEAPNTLGATAICVGNNLQVTVNTGDANFNITDGISPYNNVGFGTYPFIGPNTWTIMVTELSGDTETLIVGTFTCPTVIIVPPVVPVISAPPPVPQRCDAGGFSLEIPAGVFCTDLFANGRILIPGSIPASIASSTIEAVDIGTFDGKTVISGEFGTGLPICLGGIGRLIFFDASTSPRTQFELDTFTIDGKTCGFIINSGTVVLIAP